LTVLTGDMNEFQFDAPREFDRIVSIEMFEHMKNYSQLFQKVSTWLKRETGRLFVHVFAHKDHPYDFLTEEDGSKDSWMARYFFTGGTMPSADLFLWFQQHLTILDRWTVDGRNYGQTSEQWLQRLDANKKEAIEVLTKAYGSSEMGWIWFNRWRVFYLSCAELFNHNGGQEWPVVHFLFKRAA
ncbi:S-adenosyl-L-methionine-dependent methyltransferase, partial [Chytriomyces sp. MP71]